MSKILLIGNDFSLLTTRAAVLAQTKARLTCCNALEAGQVLQGKSFDLVVLCHSLTRTEAEEIAERTHRILPGAKILMVSSASSQDPPKGIGFDGMVSSGPAGLIRRASELLLEESILFL